ncbi:rhodanese-like domain-containing protein [Streptomyces termitum]
MSQDTHRALWAELSDEEKRVLAIRPADPAEALAHFTGRLRFETDPYDVAADQRAGHGGFTVLDVRRRPAYDAEHVAGAVHFSHHDMTPEALAALDPDQVYVTYGWGPGCNGGIRGAAKLSAAGLRAKEMMGGLEYWKRGGYPTSGTATTGEPAESPAASTTGESGATASPAAAPAAAASATARAAADAAPALRNGCCI